VTVQVQGDEVPLQVEVEVLNTTGQLMRRVQLDMREGPATILSAVKDLPSDRLRRKVFPFIGLRLWTGVWQFVSLTPAD
jgi:hypothetical protein